LRDNGPTIALVAMFLCSTLGMILSGFSAHNEELAEHGFAAIGLPAYLISGDLLSALFENWESEFTQMAAYVLLVLLSNFLRHKASPESKPTGPSNARTGA